MTSKQKQFRAVALAALMVMSVFAGTIALSGSAAATAKDVTVDSGSEVVSSGDDVTFFVNNTTDSAEDIQYWIDLNNDGFYNDSEPSGSVSADSTSPYEVSLSVPSDADEGNYQVAAVQNASLTVGDDSEATGSFEVDNTANTELNSAIHYDNDTASGSDNVDAELELAFSENVSVNEIVLTDSNGDDVAVSEGDYDVNNGRVNISLGELYTSGLEVQYNVSDDAGNVVDTTGDDDDAVDVTFASTTVKANNPNAYKGSTVAIVANTTGTDVEIDGANNYAFSGSTGDNSKVFLFKTANRDLGEYNATFDSAERTIDLRSLGLDLEVDDQNITTANSVEGTVSANAGNRPITLQLYDSSGDEFGGEVTATLNGQGEYGFTIGDFTDESGEYTLEVVDDYSGVSQESSTINVEQAGDGEADFNQSVVTEQRGDVVKIPVTLDNTNQATVKIGSPDVGFEANVTIEDDDTDGEAVILFDTWAAATSDDASKVFSAEGDDTIVTENAEDTQITTPVGSLLDAGDYDLEVRGTDASDSQNAATLVLEERSTNDVNTWTAPSSTSLSDYEDLSEAVENGELTQDDEIVTGDVVVAQINASGLGGVYADNGSEMFFGADQPVNFTVKQSEAPANREAFSLNLSSDNVNSVVADADNDTYYIAFSTESKNIGAMRNGEDVGFGDGDTLTANFTVYKNKGNLADSEESVETNFDLVNGEHTLEDPHNVSNAASQTVEGESNVAPGTELRLRIRSDSDTSPSFLKTATAVVTENNTFSADFDFSGQNVGDSYTITVSGGAADSNEKVNGNVVEGAANETETVTDDGTATVTDEPTETTDTATTEVSETTEATATEETATEETTETDTPGFGAVVALVALVAAALLATRRD